MRLTPAERCLPVSASERRVVAGSAHHQAQHAVQFAVVGIDALAAQRLEVLKDALDASHRVFRPFHMHGVGAKIDAHAERVFHQPEVFIASPKQGLKVGRDLQISVQDASRAAAWAASDEFDADTRFIGTWVREFSKILAGGLLPNDMQARTGPGLVWCRNVLARAPKCGLWGESSAGLARRQWHPSKDLGNSDLRGTRAERWRAHDRNWPARGVVKAMISG